MEDCVLVECMSGMAYLSICLFYWKTCLSGGHVLLKGMCYSGTHGVVVVTLMNTYGWTTTAKVDERYQMGIVKG